MLHVAARAKSDRVWIEPFERELRAVGTLEIRENGVEMTDRQIEEAVRSADVLITSWGASPVPASIAKNPGRLRYICHTNGSVRNCVPRELVAAGIPVTNWGDAPAQRLAEAAFTLLLAVLKDIPGRMEVVRSGGWRPGDTVYGGTLEGLDLGIYGLGVIGRHFEAMLRPFHPNVRVYDPYVADLPPTCTRVENLETLFRSSFAVAIHAGLSEETRGSVTGRLLSMLPDHGILVNTARGAIVDQDALFAELQSKRLRAGLDVLDPDSLPAEHPARTWRNVIFTAHDLGKVRSLPGQPPSLWKFHRLALENLRRFEAGEELKHVVTLERFDRST